MSEFTTLSLREATKDRLDEHKDHEKDSYDKALNEILDALEGNGSDVERLEDSTTVDHPDIDSKEVAREVAKQNLTVELEATERSKIVREVVEELR